ncbi:peptide ABC transporter permease, partial [Pseudomonas syringae pv. actinidiae ICMP 18807]
MFGFLLRRLGIALCVAITVSVISFSLLHLSGDLATAIGGPEASSEQIEQIRVQYGLNKPLVTQYFEWLADVVRLDFGDSFFFQESVYNLIASRLSITLGLGAMALSIALLIAIPLGVLAAVKRDTWVDRLALSIAV